MNIKSSQTLVSEALKEIKTINTDEALTLFNEGKCNLIDIISVIKDSDFFVGNNSGPLNLAAALNVKSFGLFANTPISQLKFSKVIPLVPENYVDNQFIKDRKEMKKLTPDKVFLDITKYLTN